MGRRERKRNWRFPLNETTLLEVSAPQGPTAKQVRMRGRLSLVLGTLVATVILVGIAGAAVGTDKQDYSPGSVVTISGDDSNNAGYAEGNTADVAVSGPNGWTASCLATVAANGSWSCQVTLSSDPAIAVGDYTYTVTSTDVDGNPISESGTFTDADATTTVVTSSPNPSIVGQSVTFTATVTYASGGANVGNRGTVKFGTGGNCTGGFTELQAEQAPTGGVVTFTTSSLTGNTTIRACYDGTGGSSPGTQDSFGTVAQVVNAAPSDATAPTGSITIDSNAAYTNTTAVTLNLSASDAVGVTGYRVANGADCSSASWVVVSSTTSYSANVPFNLSAGDGSKTVCVQYADAVPNVSTTYTDTIVLDTVKPTIVAAATTSPNGAGWYNSDVTVHFTCSDPGGSGIASCPADQVLSSEGSSVSSTAQTATDNAGNVSDPSNVVTVKIDTTAPSVVYTSQSPAANGAGWNNTDVVATFTATDTLSGFVGPSTTKTGTTSSSGEGAAVNVDSPAFTDLAGNTAAAGAASHSFMIDKTDPTVACNGASFLLNDPGAQVSAGVADSLSGPLNATESAAADASSVGSKTVSITGYDLAGNATNKSCPYTVGYGFAGLFAPIDKPNAMNVSKAGQAIPLKWRLTDYFGSPVTTLTTATVSVSSIGCALGSTADAVEEYASGSSGLQNLGDGYYQFNWKTPANYAGSCKSLNLALGEGSPRMNLAYISFKK